ncbi:hypothetical protein [Roseibacillus ishigakijimensis]|uniref:Peptidase propeptide and YPEB domain-containing protein n=1 Tax=Roseibacillus ishigakijimensis TaxID=454146 RepID=A0A934RJF3_9BACT|nr:hypothetical protein [Roseibacillus ishigakijimensis]MBK1832529.1 hypothetical protein [Roseibacillus ishigakijimensis]
MKTFKEAGPLRSGFFASLLLATTILNQLSCQNQQGPLNHPQPNQRDRPASHSFLGLTEQEANSRAQQLGLQARVTRRDGQSFIITKELRPDRINFEIDRNQVTKADYY